MSSPERYPEDQLNPERLKQTFETVSTCQNKASSTRDEFAIDSSLEIAPITKHLFDDRTGLDLETLKNQSKVSRREFHRLRKVCEVYENSWQFRLPSEPFWKAAKTAGTVSKLGGILVSLQGVHEASSTIKSVYDNRGRSAVTDSQISDFYLASGMLFGELVLMATPVSSKFAFQATGQLHSRLLWHRFKNHRAVYRLLLHHIYYIAEKIPSLAVLELDPELNPVEDFVDSIVYIVQTTWDIFEEPSFLHDLSEVEFSSSLIDNILGLSLEDIQDELVDGFDELRDYVSNILRTLEIHYGNLYEQYLGVSPTDIVRRVIQKVLKQF